MDRPRLRGPQEVLKGQSIALAFPYPGGPVSGTGFYLLRSSRICRPVLHRSSSPDGMKATCIVTAFSGVVV